MLRSALLNVMMKAARKAARGLKRDFGEVEKLQVSMKGPANFVTAADRRAEQVLREELMTARPGYSFVGEEGGRIDGPDKTHTWLVDPLDGTTNFLHGIPQFAISIGLERDGVMVAGLVYNPVSDEMFIAERGKGAFLNDQRSAWRRASAWPTRSWPAACRIYGRGDLELFRGEFGAVQEKVAGLRRFGAAALDLAFIAAGPLRHLLGAQSLALGHGGRHPAGARGRRLCHRLRRRRSHVHEEPYRGRQRHAASRIADAR